MIGKPDNMILKSVTGLEGGCVAGGSTCGVITGGAMGLAFNSVGDILREGVAAERSVIARVQNYVRWFEGTYGTSLCRERTKTDFNTISGLIRYLLPGDRIVRCMWHIRGAMRHLHDIQNQDVIEIKGDDRISAETPFHCAQAVLSGIRQNTDVGDMRLERLAFVFDGGVAYAGGLCGALAGAVMAINLMMGLPTRSLSYWKIIHAFVIGHINLIKAQPMGPPEPFMAGREVVEHFKASAGSLECRSITGKDFSGWDDLQNYVLTSHQCSGVIDTIIRKTSDIILRYKK
ncbi:MAG: C-GCAxxG-C-C family protein [Desulfobacterales bacterium]|nr:C-GCAxxG-C-C family protein [Desulfobacterales bacterium]